MFRNQYDNDATTWSPQGRLHQVEYALEAVKQGSCCIALRSNQGAVLVCLKRQLGDLSDYQDKIVRIDDHLGIAYAGLSSDARVLSNFMRTQALRSKLQFKRPLPVYRIVNQISDKAQANTQNYGSRPYGVGFLVIGYDETGSHVYEFSPSGNFFEYYAMSIGGRSQSAKTYLEKHLDSFHNASIDELVKHGLLALRDTLQQDKELNKSNLSVAVVGKDVNFKQLSPEELQIFLGSMDSVQGGRRTDAAPSDGNASSMDTSS